METNHGYCKCGCGKKTRIANSSYDKLGWIKGEPLSYITGHNRRIQNQIGDKNANWNGGKCVKNGYIYLLRPSHPNADKKGYVAEHILVAEKAIGKYLHKGVIVHHINGNPSDNRNDNLIICPDITYHFLLHKRQKALQMSGNPNYERCKYCKEWDNTINLSSSTDHRYKNKVYRAFYHKECSKKYAQKLRDKQKEGK